MRLTVTVMMIVLLGVGGLATVAFCDMPADCPMRQMAGQAQHDCCAPQTIPTDGWAGAACHLRVADTSAIVTPAPTITLPLVTTLLVAADHVAPPLVGQLADVPALPVAVPRFLLTHTFRL